MSSPVRTRTTITVQDDSPTGQLFYLHPAFELDERSVTLDRIIEEIKKRHPGREIKRVFQALSQSWFQDVDERTMPWADVTVQLVSEKALKASDAAGKDGDGH